MVGAPEIQLMDPPKTNKKRGSERKAVPPPKPEYLRFEDISAAAFKIQSAMQKTPCTVCPLQFRAFCTPLEIRYYL